MNTEAELTRQETSRGQSVYDILQMDGWKSIKSPFCMRHADCFRKGNRRAFIQSTWEERGPVTFYFAREGFPSVDSFGQRFWKHGGIIAADENMPFDLLTKYNKE